MRQQAQGFWKDKNGSPFSRANAQGPDDVADDRYATLFRRTISNRVTSVFCPSVSGWL
jgi:hypothetical protein